MGSNPTLSASSGRLLIGRLPFFIFLREVFDAWEWTREIADALAAPTVLFQCPASFEPTPQHKENMRDFFGAVDDHGLTFAWEPRGSWEAAEIASLCQDLDLIHCVDPFKPETVTQDLAYFRLHGIDSYYHNYTDHKLEQVRTWCEPFETAYVLFNNVSLWKDGLRLREMLGPA